MRNRILLIKQYSNTLQLALQDTLSIFQNKQSLLESELNEQNQKLQHLKLDLEHVKGQLWHVETLSQQAFFNTGKVEYTTETIRVDNTCGCYYGYRCERGGCTGQGMREETHTKITPILAADERARARALAKIPALQEKVEALTVAYRPKIIALKQEIRLLKDALDSIKKFNTLLKDTLSLCSLLSAYKPNFNQFKGFDRHNHNPLFSLYMHLDDGDKPDLIHLLVSLDYSKHLFFDFVSALVQEQNGLEDELPLHLFGMESIGHFSDKISTCTFQLELLESKYYKAKPKFDKLREELRHTLVIESTKKQTERLLNADQFWMISPHATVNALDRLARLIEDPNYRKAQNYRVKTYKELIQKWQNETALSNFSQEKITVGQLINTHRNIFSLFSNEDTKTQEFISSLLKDFGSFDLPFHDEEEAYELCCNKMGCS